MTPTSSILYRAAALIFLCLPFWGFETVSSQSVEIIPHWNKGDKIELKVTRVRDKSLNGQSTVSGKTHTRFSLEVLQASAQGYLVGWTVGATTFDVPAPTESVLRQVVDLMQGMQILLQIDPRGAITGVQNWEALRGEMLRNLDGLSAKTADSQRGKSVQGMMAKLQAQWGTMFSTKAQVEQICTRDARIYLKILGRTYTQNQPYEHQGFFENPLGGDPFPTRADIVLKSFNRRSGQAVLHWNQSADREQADRIMQSLVKDVAARKGKQVPEEGFLQNIVLENHIEVEVDVGTGWVTTVTETKSVNLGTRAQTDTTFMVRAVQ
ncbi:MAG: hypothetical protein OEY77_15190 [Nitrospira sp.]|nr:hypothetical protein [Nitrospira sp.]